MPWWRFWRPETEQEKLSYKQQKDAVFALENGDIPPTAKKRIQEQLDRKDAFFVSDLSVREFLLMKETGIEPVSQVMGTCFFNVSYWGSYMGPYRATGELVKITDAQTLARKTACDRMKQEAKMLDASGVVGVRIVVKHSGMASRMSEFTAFGTAVKIPGYPPGQEPFVSGLNGQDFWQLYKAGYRPRGLVMGLCSYYMWSNWRTSTQMYGLFGMGSWTNQEVDQYTRGFNEARERAQSRLGTELAELAADGVVGMTIDHHIEKIEHGSGNSEQIDMLVTFMAVGTAVDEGAPAAASNPLLCIDLSKGRNSGALMDINMISGANQSGLVGAATDGLTDTFTNLWQRNE